MKERSDTVVEGHFSCAECGARAGSVQLFGNHSTAEIRRASFTSLLSGPVPVSQFDDLRIAIWKEDARALFELDFEYAPFFCPECNAIYCGAHWQTMDEFDDDGYHDCIRGSCPNGHDRMLED